jgi:hypothetical protein
LFVELSDEEIGRNRQHNLQPEPLQTHTCRVRVQLVFL